MKLSGVQVGVAGDIWLPELSRRGYVASLTLRNTRGIDILASNLDATKSVGIQVKTSRGAKPKWIMSKKAEADVAENCSMFSCAWPQTPQRLSTSYRVRKSEVCSRESPAMAGYTRQARTGSPRLRHAELPRPRSRVQGSMGPPRARVTRHLPY